MQPQDPMGAGSDQSGFGQPRQSAPGPDQWFQPQTTRPTWQPESYPQPAAQALPAYPAAPAQNYGYTPIPGVTGQTVALPPNPGVSPMPQALPGVPSQPYPNQPYLYPQQQTMSQQLPGPGYAAVQQQPYYGTPPPQPQPQPQPQPYAMPAQQPYTTPNPSYSGSPIQQQYMPYAYTASSQPLQQPQMPFPNAPAPQPNPYGPFSHNALPEHLLAPEPKSKKKIALITGVGLASLLVLTLITLTLKNVLTSIKLTTFSTDDYSLLVPASYKKIDNGDGFAFQEDDDEASRSLVETYYSKFNPEISAEDVKAVKETLRTQLKTQAVDKTAANSQTLTGLKIIDSRYKGNDALILTADITKDNSFKGTLRMIAIVDSKQLYIFGIAANKSDKSLIKKQDAIINSFTLK